MDATTLQGLGVVEIGGAEVFGGTDPIVVGIVVATYTIVVGGIVTHWAEFKDGIFAGFNDATH